MKNHQTFFCFFALLLLSNLTLSAQREVILLDQGWGYKPISATKNNVALTSVTIPHTWNANYIEGTTLYNREMMVYKRPLEITPAMKGKRLFLYFEGVNSVADIFVNRQTVGQHHGGYTAFCLEITDYVTAGNNELEVWVSNAYRTDVMPISGDFNVYGGIHRPCHLVVTENNCISPLFYASPGLFIHQENISKQCAEIMIETMFSLKEKKAGLTLKTSVIDATGKIVANQESDVKSASIKQPFKIANPTLWNGKKNPYLYTVIAELYDNGKLIDRVSQKTGFRFFHVDPDKGFFLNGEYLDLYGFCRHEDVEGKGSALTKEDYNLDMSIINEIGATAMRLAHYPHAEPMYNLCDENGIVLWTEIPFCGPGGYAYTGYLKNEAFENNGRLAVKELVYQKYNHPSIVFWGIFNEILLTVDRFKAYDNPVPYVKELNALYKSIDKQRLTAFATCVDQTDYLDCADLVAWNKYFGWYSDAAPAAGKFFDHARATSNNKPVGVSEYGAGGSVKHHQWPLNASNKISGSNIVDGMLPASFHPEEAQAHCHEGNWDAFSERPYLWGKFIWLFADFQSSIRREGDKDGINDKGLLTYDRKTKKDAFYFYKANWNPEPMLYIASHRFVERTEALTQIKVYSNLKEATLYINGKKIGVAKKDRLNRMLWNDVKLAPGKNEVLVKGKAGKVMLEDACTLILK
ncbi:glycoside hydrolase family 2 protein [Bacteroides sp. 214]|uniref:glycoside hydrolase family 2 protein n=1 Tax=Bacteroides sp. 214 TaxID=2302935 RepID=UPI0013D84D64|nr:glycoside hydrolase family 2 TIM barrel-domain containing protein [Bacteroides sp. 214]NDW11485.1 glycoside hydrolase family 2 protein [Bacteroides sp. 214]